MIDIPLNVEVACTDGPAGKSVQVIVNPINRKITHFVVKAKHLTESKERLVPVDKVVGVSRKLIGLNCTKDELAELEPFVVTRYVQKWMPNYPTSYYGGEPWVYANPYYQMSTEVEFVQEAAIPPGKLAIHRGTTVEATDGLVGRVEGLLVNPDSEQITHVVVRGGQWGNKDLTLPITAVDRVSGDTVHLKLDQDSIERLPTIPVNRSLGWWDAEIELVVLMFKDVDKADEVLQFLKELRKQGAIPAIRNAAVLIKDKEGQVSWRETEDVDAKQGRLFGAIAGGLIGLLGGPIGAVIGAAAGAATGGVAAEQIDMGFSNKYLKDLQKHLQPGNSALIALVEHKWSGKVVDALDQFGGQLFRQALPDEIIAELMSSTE